MYHAREKRFGHFPVNLYFHFAILSSVNSLEITLKGTGLLLQIMGENLKLVQLLVPLCHYIFLLKIKKKLNLWLTAPRGATPVN